MTLTVIARSGDVVALAEGDTLVDEFDCTAIKNRGGRFAALANLDNGWFESTATYTTAEAAWDAAGITWDEVYA